MGWRKKMLHDSFEFIMYVHDKLKFIMYVHHFLRTLPPNLLCTWLIQTYRLRTYIQTYCVYDKFQLILYVHYIQTYCVHDQFKLIV